MQPEIPNRLLIGLALVTAVLLLLVFFRSREVEADGFAEQNKETLGGSYADVKQAIRAGSPTTAVTRPSKPAQSLADVFAKTDEDDLITGLYDHAYYRYQTAGARHLSVGELAVLTVLELEGEVNNGGFDQYFFNSSGDLAQQLAPSLQRIGAQATLKMALEALAVFPHASPSADRKTRWEQMDRMSKTSGATWDRLDTAFYASTEPLRSLLARYARAHPQEFSAAD